MIINQTEYYVSEPIKWQDEHGGIRAGGFSYNYILITKDGQFVFITRDTKDFNIIDYFKSKSKSELENDTSIMYGTYQIDKGVLSYNYKLLGIEYYGQFTYLSPSTLLDKNLREYNRCQDLKFIEMAEEE